MKKNVERERETKNNKAQTIIIIFAALIVNCYSTNS